MAFTDNEELGAMLILLNGLGKSGRRVDCPRCGRPMLRVFTTAGARRVDPSLSAWRDVCINARWMGPIPCPEALAAKGLIDQLMDAARA